MSLAPLQGRYPNQTAKSRYKCAIHLITLVVGPGRRKSLRLIHVPRRLSRFSLGLLFCLGTVGFTVVISPSSLSEVIIPNKASRLWPISRSCPWPVKSSSVIPLRCIDLLESVRLNRISHRIGTLMFLPLCLIPWTVCLILRASTTSASWRTM